MFARPETLQQYFKSMNPFNFALKLFDVGCPPLSPLEARPMHLVFKIHQIKWIQVLGYPLVEGAPIGTLGPPSY